MIILAFDFLSISRPLGMNLDPIIMTLMAIITYTLDPAVLLIIVVRIFNF